VQQIRRPVPPRLAYPLSHLEQPQHDFNLTKTCSPDPQPHTHLA